MGKYLEEVASNPAQQCRDAAQYLRDCMGYFGTELVHRPYGMFTRFKLFDAEFDNGRDTLVGHEAVQEKIYGLLTDFIRHGRVNRLILLNGPNGSAKSRLISCLMRGAEYYSQQPEGAHYSFSWIFPSGKLDKSGIGFGSTAQLSELASYAHVDESNVDARINNETNDHPLLLLPKNLRLDFLARLFEDLDDVPLYLREGDLSQKTNKSLMHC